jgi:SNF2 family DNA or RNA helicase
MDIEKILTDPTKLKQALLHIYGYQTSEEQVEHSTRDSNGVGFNMIDAEILTSFAEQVVKGWELSDKQYVSLRLRLPKYHRQLSEADLDRIVVPPVTRTNGQSHKYQDLEIVSSNTPKPVQEDTGEKFTGLLELDGKGGLIFTPNVYPSKQIKTVGFTRWDGKAWHQPNGYISDQVVRDIVKLFGNVKIDPAITEALKPVEVVLPTYIAEHEILFPFQKQAIEFAVTYKRVLIGLAPGLGKTVTAIMAAQAAGCKRILIVSPLSLMYNWRNEVKKWLGEDSLIWYKRALPLEGKWTVTNYDTLRLHPQQFYEVKWDAIVVDESIMIKHRKAKRTQIVKQLMIESNPTYCWLLSGAPISRLYDDLWSQFHVLNPRRFSSYWRFVDQYCIREETQWSKYNIVGNQPGAGERIKEDLKDIYISYTQDDVLDLPEFMFETVAIPMGKDQDKMYADMEEEFVATLPESTKLVASNVLAQMTRLIQIASNPVLVNGKDDSPKWDAVLEQLQFRQGPFIIWTSFIETARAMVDRLTLKGYKVAKLTGATKPEERQAIVDEYQAGKLDIIVAHPGVGKYGLTLTACRTAIYLERQWFADDYYQSLHRIRRIGTKFAPNVVHLVSERATGVSGSSGGGTVDHVIDKLLEGRRDSVIKITSRELKELFWKEKKNA